MIAIIDTGGANLASLQNAFARLDQKCVVTLDRAQMEKASHLLLPGVGHAKVAMEQLKKYELIDYIKEQKKPVLGICLGMQILYSFLDEGDVNGLEIISGRVQKLTPTEDLRVPHMGWSRIDKTNADQDSALLKNLDSSEAFYFIHSFAAPNGNDVKAVSTGATQIPAVVEYKNFYATQFHPEKSGDAGAQILKNFLAISPFTNEAAP